jgi:hypothetical protein
MTKNMGTKNDKIRRKHEKNEKIRKKRTEYTMCIHNTLLHGNMKKKSGNKKETELTWVTEMEKKQCRSTRVQERKKKQHDQTSH